MRNLALILLSSFVLAPTASAQNTPWAQKIFFGVTNHDFGNCPRGAQLKHRFRMKNLYAVPLEITEIRSSCGCMKYKASTKKLAPQEEGYVEIIIDGKRFSGPKSFNLFVTVGPTYISTAVIRVTANARTDVVFNPGEVNFGVVPAGTSATKSIDVEYAGKLDWRILEVVKSKTAPFDVVPTEIYRQPNRLFSSGKAGYRLEVTLRPDAPPGPFHQEILLKTNDPASPVLTVCVDGNIQASLTALPSNIRLGTIKVGTKLTKRVVVSGNQPFQIKSIDGTDNEITAVAPAQVTNAQVITLQIAPSQTGLFRKELTILTNVGSGESVTVSVEATVKN